MRLTTQRMLLTGMAVAVFSGLGLASAGSAGTAHIDVVAPPSATAAPAPGPLPGGDTTAPVAAFALLASAAVLAWVVRRTAPASVVAIDETPAPVADLASHRAPTGTSSNFTSPAAA